MFNEQFYLEMSRYFKMQYTFICFIFMFLTGKCILKINYRNSLKLMGGKKCYGKLLQFYFLYFILKRQRLALIRFMDVAILFNILLHALTFLDASILTPENAAAR